jgi:hypothetical protein
MRFQTASGEEQGDIASTLQYQVEASFGDVQEYKKNAGGLGELKATSAQG